MNDLIKKFLRDISRETLMAYGKLDEVKLLDYQNAVHHDWQSMILLDGTAVKISFKVYFYEKDIVPLIIKKVGKDKIPDNFRASFMNEFTNVTAGRISQDLSTNGYRTKISLPLHTKVLHGIEFFKIGDQVYKDTWECQWSQNESILCSVTLMAKDPEFHANFKIPESSDNLGTIDFL